MVRPCLFTFDLFLTDFLQAEVESISKRESSLIIPTCSHSDIEAHIDRVLSPECLYDEPHS